MPTLRQFLVFLVLCFCAVSLRAELIVLKWTAPGDDGKSGRASQYDLRYATFLITAANWASATQVTGLPKPLPYGNKETRTVSNLLPGTTYYFAIKTADEQVNWSAMSNVVQRTTCAGCVGNTGNLNNSADNRVDLADLSMLVSYLTSSSGVQICLGEANVDGSAGGVVSLTDLSYLVSYLTSGGVTLPHCP